MQVFLIELRGRPVEGWVFVFFLAKFWFFSIRFFTVKNVAWCLFFFFFFLKYPFKESSLLYFFSQSSLAI